MRVNRAPFPKSLLSNLPSGVETLPTDSVVDHLYSLLLQANAPAERVQRLQLAYSGATLVGRGLDPDAVIAQLISDLHRFIAEFSRKELFVHAGVVGWEEGAIIFPGKSLSGKSTLIAELVRAGAEYYSDEYAVLDRKGWVYQYRVPISLREEGNARRQIPVSGSKGNSLPPAVPVKAVILTSFEPGVRWRPRRLSPGQAVLGMLAHTVQARTRTQLAIHTLQRVAANCIALKGRRGDARETAAMILAGLSGGT